MATWQSLGINVNPNGPQNQKVKCPACSGQRKDKADKSLSVNLGGKYNCHYCGWKGHTSDDMSYGDLYGAKQKQYNKPPELVLPLSDKTVAWFKTRGIEPETLQYYKVTESKDWMPARGDTPAGPRTCINFNYYRGEEKVNIKFRDSLKCFRLVKDAELILYNLNCLNDRTDMLICEGEIDAMTFYQSGHYGAVSVPNGASKGSAKLEYLDNCGEYLDKMDKIIIAVDGDEAGSFLRKELTNRFGAHRCWFVEYPEGCKDANEVLLKYGKDAVVKLWKNATPPPMEDIIMLRDVEADLRHIYQNGWPSISPIGYPGFDKLLNFAPGEVTTVTGIPQHGKDEFITQVLIRKASRYGETSGIFNFEETPLVIYTKLAQKYVGKPFYRANRADMMNPAQADAAYKFLNDRIFILDITKADLSIDGVLKKGEELVLRKGIKYYVIGPYNCLEGGRDPGQSEGEYVSMLYQKMTRFALRHKVHVFFVAHTTKMSKDGSTGKFEVPNLYSIAGSANFFNKTHNGITVYADYVERQTRVFIQKVKFFFNGEKGMQTFDFDIHTARYAEPGQPFESELEYKQKQEVQSEFEFPPFEDPPIAPKSDGSKLSREDEPPAPMTYASAFDVDLNQWNGPIPESEAPF